MAQPTPNKSRQKNPPSDTKGGKSGSRRAGASARLAPPSAKSPPQRKPVKTAGKATESASGMAAELRQLRAERAALVAELEAAKQRIAALETARAEAINRIDWVIDSLQGLHAIKP